MAYWYFRLNGLFQIENFVLHPGRRGGQRTDADLLAVRFPNRAEFLYDRPDRPMPDDVARLSLSGKLIDRKRRHICKHLGINQIADRCERSRPQGADRAE